jgi:glutathione S-transferase
MSPKLSLPLLGHPASPLVRKVRLAAATLRLPLAVRDVERESDQTLVPPMKAAALAEPVLLTPDAGPVYDSRVIIAYFEHLAGVSLRPPEALAGIVDQRVEVLGDALARAAVTTWAGTTGPATDQVTALISALANALSRAALPTEQVTAGGLSAACALSFIKRSLPAVTWRTTHADLAQWLMIWRDLPLWDSTETQPPHRP